MWNRFVRVCDRDIAVRGRLVRTGRIDGEQYKFLDDPEPVRIDQLAERVPFGVARLHAALFGLELKGAVEQLTGGYYLGRPRKGT